jgi:hypothetical protein
LPERILASAVSSGHLRVNPASHGRLDLAGFEINFSLVRSVAPILIHPEYLSTTGALNAYLRVSLQGMLPLL